MRARYLWAATIAMTTAFGGLTMVGPALASAAGSAPVVVSGSVLHAPDACLYAGCR